MSLLNMSLSAAVMILVIIVIRALTLYKLPKKTFPALWAVVLVRLLAPYKPVFHLKVASAQTMVRLPATTYIPMTRAVHQAENVYSAPAATVPIWKLIWLVGALACAAFFAAVYVRCLRDFRRVEDVNDPYISAWLSAHGRGISVKSSDTIPSPLTYGLFHPVILLPKDTDLCDTGVLSHVLAHEYAHIRSYDAAFKALMTVALCLHWLNPMVWVMFFLANRDIELRCDETAIFMSGGGRSGYAMALIHMEEAASPFCPGNSFGKNAIEERIEAIMKMNKISGTSRMAAFVLAAALSMAFATTTVSAKTSEVEAEARDSVVVTDNITMTENAPTAEDFKEYESYGLKYDESARILTYNGQRVRYFFDGADTGDAYYIVAEYADFEQKGEIDVHTLRQKVDNKDGSYSLLGPLTGLEVYSQEEFDARNISMMPAQLAVTLEGGVPEATYIVTDKDNDLTVAFADNGIFDEKGQLNTLEQIFARYKDFGVTYDPESGNIYYNGKPAASFADITPEGGAFSYTSKDVTGPRLRTVYDDNGNLTGVEEVK